MSTPPNALRRRPARPSGRAWILVGALALTTSVAACRSRRAPVADAGPAPVTTAQAPVEAPPPPDPTPAPRFEAPDASFQKRGELLDTDVRRIAEQSMAALHAGDAAALANLVAPGVDAAALARKLKGRLGEGPQRFEDAVLTPNLIELRYGITHDTDASAPRYIQEVHLLYARVEGFLPWRLTDAFVPGQ